MATPVVPRPAGWFADAYGTAAWRWWDDRASRDFADWR